MWCLVQRSAARCLTIGFLCHLQRAHQNTLESLPVFLVSQLLIAQVHLSFARSLMHHILGTSVFRDQQLLFCMRT